MDQKLQRGIVALVEQLSSHVVCPPMPTINFEPARCQIYRPKTDFLRIFNDFLDG